MQKGQGMEKGHALGDRDETATRKECPQGGSVEKSNREEAA